MDRHMKSARFSIVLGLLSVLAVVASHLALTDISHGEGDLSLEWTVLRISFAVIVAFHISALITLVRLYRYTASKPGEPGGPGSRGTEESERI